MTDQPIGQPTFLFTDIEGSTKRWENNPEAMAEALARHDTILREAFVANGGHVFKTVGDAFYGVFPEPADALRAAVQAQEGLGVAVWSEVTGPIRVRMALHVGPAIERGGDYFGPTLNRVARLLSSGHGGQVLLSHTAQEQLKEQLPPDAGLRDMGERRFKDLTRAERVFQLLWPELPREFPPLKTLDARPNNLPIQATPLIGREREVDRARQELNRSDVRFLTLTGPGGTGKTRLGLQIGAEVVDDFDHGVFFVPLAPVSDPDLVISAIAQELGVQETAGGTMLDNLKFFLREKVRLLVLDNFEQVVPAAPAVAGLLSGSPRLKILVTSRHILRVYGEHELAVPPLDLPDPDRLPPINQLLEYEALRLFAERARAAKPDFELNATNVRPIAQICLRLDGLPLAIELAAARVKILTPTQLLSRLDDSLKLLTTGSRDLPARQQTLRGAIEWSHTLLDETEKRFFARVAVFVSGFGLDAAEIVCDADGALDGMTMDLVESLVDKSLLRREEAENDIRFSMLGTIREFAYEHLVKAGELDAMRQDHANYFLRMAEDAEPALTGPNQIQRVGELGREHDNIRAAVNWAREVGDSSVALRLTGALWRFWMVRGFFSEGRERLSSALALSDDPSPERAKALLGVGVLARYQNDVEAARAALELSRDAYMKTGDRKGTATALVGLGMVAHVQGDYVLARESYTQSLAIQRELKDIRGSANSLNNLGRVVFAEGDLEGAKALYAESLALQRKLGDSNTIANSLNNLGYVAAALGELDRARTLYEESLGIRRALGGRPGIAHSLVNLGCVARDLGELDRARLLFDECLQLAQDIGDLELFAEILEAYAGLAAIEQKAEKAVRIRGAAIAVREVIAVPLSPVDRARWEKILAPAMALLGVSDTERALAEGGLLTVDEAMEYARSRE